MAKALSLMDLLKVRGAEVAYYDPHVPVIRPRRKHGHWAGLTFVPWDRETIAPFDAVVIATAHGAVRFKDLATGRGASSTPAM